jgi:hypothetical protein
MRAGVPNERTRAQTGSASAGGCDGSEPTAAAHVEQWTRA